MCPLHKTYYTVHSEVELHKYRSLATNFITNYVTPQIEPTTKELPGTDPAKYNIMPQRIELSTKVVN